jgi:hypothetical protein
MATVGSVFVYQRGIAGRLPPPEIRGGRALKEPLSRATAAAADKPAAPARVGKATLDNLTIGDVVQDGPSDFVVAGTVRFREEKDAWAHHLLDGGIEKRWLEVRAVSGTSHAAFLEPAPDAPTFGALGAGLTWRGKPFSLSGRGDARASVEGDVEGRAAGTVKYSRYSGPSGEALWIEEEGNKRRALLCREVAPSSLSLLGGELVRERGE